MRHNEALNIAADAMFDVMRDMFPRGFSYHPEYGIVAWGLYPRDMTEEQFAAEAKHFDPTEDDLESFVMLVEESFK